MVANKSFRHFCNSMVAADNVLLQQIFDHSLTDSFSLPISSNIASLMAMHHQDWISLLLKLYRIKSWNLNFPVQRLVRDQYATGFGPVKLELPS